MKSYFHTYGKWLPMIAICILSSAFLSCSSDDWEPREVPEDYKPVFKEGKTWTYAKGESSYTYTYTINGDTVVKGKKYLKLYCSDTLAYGDTEQHYYAAVREESLRAFYILKGEKKEKLLFDFGMDVDVDFEIGPLPPCYVKIIHEPWSQDFLGTPRRIYNWTYYNKKSGIGVLTCYYWYEGIGNNPDLLDYGGWDHYLISCYEDGRCIYDRELLFPYVP